VSTHSGDYGTVASFRRYSPLRSSLSRRTSDAKDRPTTAKQRAPEKHRTASVERKTMKPTRGWTYIDSDEDSDEDLKAKIDK
jgi:hypothetical protein